MYVKKNSWVKHLDFILADLLCINLTLLIAYFYVMEYVMYMR